jgi:hypothetical protein
MRCVWVRRKRIVGVSNAGIFRDTLMVIVSNRNEPNGGNTIVPIAILSAGPLALYDQVPSSETTVFEEVCFVTSGDDDGINGVIPIVVRAIHGPIGVDV